MCLVLANVGYFLWARGIAKTPEVTAELRGLLEADIALPPAGAQE